MSRREDFEARTSKLLEPIAARYGVEIYDVEYVKEGGNWFLRAFIDKGTGVTIDDCERVSRALSDRLDQEDFIPDSYMLEVCSPGLGRTLKKDAHFQKSLGERVDVKLYRPFQGGRAFSGSLEGFDGETIRITADDGRLLRFPRKDVASVRLVVQL